jgi:ribosomal protein L17
MKVTIYLSAEIDLEGKDLNEIVEKFSTLAKEGSVLDNASLTSIDNVLDERTMEDLTEQFFKEYSK